MSTEHLVRKSWSVVLLALVWALGGSVARADVISTFNSGAEGWVSFQNGGEAVVYNPSGGNPGGYISVRDMTTDWGYLQAPAGFLVGAAYGGAFSFDLQVHTSDVAVFPVLYNVRVGLAGSGIYLINESSLPTDSWAVYAFALHELSGWRLASSLSQNYDPAGAIPTAMQMQAVLTGLAGLYIAADYTNGWYDDTAYPRTLDETSIDNVWLQTPIPEPATLTLVGLGLLGAVRARRRK